MSPTRHVIDTIRSVLAPVKTIDYAFLFGSAGKKLLPGSDADILVGGRLTFDDRLSLTAELATRLKRDVDPVLVEEARASLVLKAMARGVPVFAKGREALKDGYSRNRGIYDDATASRQMMVERMKRHYAHGR